MGAQAASAPPDSPDSEGLGAGMDELRVETIHLAVIGVFGLAFGALGVAALGLNRVEADFFGVLVGLAVVAGGAAIAIRFDPEVAAVGLVGGLAVILSVAVIVWQSPGLAPWFAFVVLLASALLDWRWGAVAALIVNVILIAAMHLPAPGMISGDVALSACLLSWASLFTTWLLSRPTRAALAWAWSSYGQALDQMKRARERQAELARLSKGLGESYYRMEQLNLELERARRAAQEARRLKAEFAAAVSHELRTPLNLIIGFCEMMVLSPSAAYGQRLPANYQNDLEAIYRNACHISALVDDILDLSQIDADRMALHREWTPLRQVVDEAVATVESLFRDRELTLKAIVPDGLPRALVDPTRVRQILINLLSNAARFLDQGGVTVQVERAGDRAILSVADTGPGIPADELPDVFEEFYQVHGPARRRGGSGLGLTISKRFAELHGGTMWVNSALGQGSTFFLQLPFADAGQSVGAGDADWQDRLATRVRGNATRRVLVIEESGEVPRVFQRYLDGYQVLRASGVAGARRHVKAGPVHAVILGSPKAQKEWGGLRRVPPELANLPVISCPLHTARQTAAELGVAGYLVKPVTRDQLRGALRGLDREVRTVLIVDDDDEMTRLLTRMIDSFGRGTRCWTARDGRDSLDLLRAHRPDVVLLDLLMPGVNGYAVLEALKQDPELSRTPVLVVTARGLQDEAILANAFSVARDNGLTVAEVMRWLKSGLDSLLEANSSAPASRAARPA